MTRNILVGVALLAMSAPGLATVPAPSVPPPAAPVSAEQHKLAMQLVRILNSEELTRAQLARMLNDTLPKTLAASPNFAMAEKAHPGITGDFIEAMRPIIVEGTISRMSSLWDRLEPIYARSFTTAELHVLVDFYTSPVGARLIKAMGEGSDYSQMLSNMIAGGNSTVTVEDLHAGIQTGTAAVIRSATDEDMKAMIALAATSAGKKLPAINQQVQAEAAAWGNEPHPELNEQVIKAVQGVIAKYSEKPVQ